MKYTTLIASLLAGLGTVTAQADYRAEAVQTTPGGQVMRAQIVVGKDAMRTEFRHDGESVVQIINFSNGQKTILFPARKTYMQGSSGDPVPHGRHSNPCELMPGAKCVEQGRESRDGHPVIKWQVNVNIQGRNLVSTQWVDTERGMPLRIISPNGEQTDSHLLGKESMQGREVEKWETTTKLPNGQSLTGRQWYDPVLDTLLREELPDGAVRELKKIEIGDLPAELFSVPTGYMRIEPSAGSH